MARMLITGVSGMLGSNLAHYFRGKYEVLGLYCSHAVVIDGVRTQKGDILSAGPLKRIVEEFSPEVVIHCASLTDVDFCESHRELTRKVNVLGTRAVADTIAGANANLIYISSDSVYDGGKGDFCETDPIGPMNCYGQSKYEGELEALRHGNSLVLRTNIFGWSIQERLGIAERIMRDLAAGRSIKGFRDVYFSAIYTFDLAKIMDLAIERNLTGTYNCGSGTSLSKYDFAVHLADRFGFNKSLIDPISVDEFPLDAKRGKNLSISVDKLAGDLDYKPPTIIESIDAFRSDFGRGLHQKIRQGCGCSE